MEKVIFDLPSFSVVYTLVEEKLKTCESCKDKDGKLCFHSVLLRVLDSLSNSVFCEEENEKDTF